MTITTKDDTATKDAADVKGAAATKDDTVGLEKKNNDIESGISVREEAALMGEHATIDDSKLPFFQRFVSYITARSGDENTEEIAIQRAIISTRELYEPLDFLHFYLHSWKDFDAMEPLMKEWMIELSQGLDEWIDKVLHQVLTFKMKPKHE